MNDIEVLSRLKRAGVWSKKNLGQHFLIDSSALQAMVETADLKDSDTVVEIGPGLGVLSKELLKGAKRVVAFEYDPEMVAILNEDYPELEVVSGDVLKTALDLLPELGIYKVVANIPYQITTLLIRLFVEGEFPPTSLTLLMQKEVAERLTAGPRETGRGYLSVLIEYFGTARYVRTIPASSFWPAPEVQSAIIQIDVAPSRPFSGETEREFLVFVHRFFIQPRKQLKNVMAGMRGVSSSEVYKYFKKLHLPENIRAQELSLEQWILLYKNPQ